MATFSIIDAETGIDLSEGALVTVDTVTTTTPTEFSFSSSSDSADDIDVLGSGFTYSGGNLTGGTINSVDLLIILFAHIITNIQITGLATTSAQTASIDSNARSFWNVVLGGDDTFQLSGLSEASMGAVSRSVIFGDDLSSATSVLPVGFSDSGGDDTMIGTDNEFDLIGDVFTVQGSAGSPLASIADYNAGDDVIKSGFTASRARLIGDAFTVGNLAILRGGDDVLDNSGNRNHTSFAVGDVYEQTGGTVIGGNDTITLDSIGNPEGSGDVRTFSGGTVIGGDDIITGSRGSFIAGDVEQILGATTSGTINGGNDQIYGGDDGDFISGDVRIRNSISNMIGGGDDLLFGGAGSDSLFGEVYQGSLAGVSGGDDVIFGGSGNDRLQGQTGDDFLDGGDGNDTINGGIGNDTVSYATAFAGVTVNMGVGLQLTGGSGNDVITNVENLEGSRFNDVLTDKSGVNVIDSGAGNDIIRSGLGDDLLIGGTGFDTLDYSASTQAVDLNLALGTATGAAIGNDLAIQFENATGGAGSDTLRGANGANSLIGNGGADTILGLDGADVISGGAGIDTVNGGLGKDILAGGAGADTFLFETLADTALGANRDVIQDLETLDRLDISLIDASATASGDQDFTFLGQGSANHTVGQGETKYYHFGGNTYVVGNTTADSIADFQIEIIGLKTLTVDNFLGLSRAVLTGSSGDDTLRGTSGDDTLSGLDGSDVLIGKLGKDSLLGGLGTDTFRFGGAAETELGGNRDVIGDWDALDIIDVSFIDANTTLAGNQNFTFLGVGAANHTVAQGEMKFYQFGGNTYVVGNTTADTTADFQIEITGTHTLTSSDFLGVI